MKQRLLSSIQFVFWIGVMFLIPLLGGIMGGFSFAQSERKHIREGNKQYEENKYEDAEISYRKALDKNEKSYEGVFNLGDASYKQKKYEDAVNHFELLTHKESDKETKAKSYHNLGNSLLQSKKYEESIEAYKNALRNNPRDLDTKYNLAYARAKLKQEQEQQQQEQENKEQDQQQEENKSQQKEQDNKKEQNKEGEKEQEQDQTQQKEQQQQPRPDQISKKDAERLLDAINNEEKNIQEKLKKKKARVTKVKIEKDW